METIMHELDRENLINLFQFFLFALENEQNRDADVILDQYSADGSQRFIISAKSKDIFHARKRFLQIAKDLSNNELKEFSVFWGKHLEWIKERSKK